MFWLIVGFFIIIFLALFMGAILKVGVTKSSPCPNCNKKIKMLTNSVKCPFCKVKFIKNQNGEYQAKV